MRTCNIEGCDRPRWTAGICRTHHRRRANGLPMNAPIQDRVKNKLRTCKCAGCLLPARALGLCNAHVQKYYTARKIGTLETGEWKDQIRRRRTDSITMARVRFPIAWTSRLSKYAEERGLRIDDAMVEAATKFLAELPNSYGPRETHGLGELERIERDGRDAVLVRMIRDGVETPDICDALPSMSRDAIHQRISRMRRANG